MATFGNNPNTGAPSAGGGGDFGFLGNVVSSAASNVVNTFLGNSLAGSVAKSQGKAYNKYQDLTYGPDTERMLSRMDRLFPGTTPYERLGTAPVQPVGGPDRPQMDDSFLPLQIAAMNNQTALKQTQIQADTAKEVAGMQTGAQRDVAAGNNRTAELIAIYAQTGPKAQQERALLAAQTITQAFTQSNLGAQTKYTEGQTNFLRQQVKESDSRIALNAAHTEAAKVGIEATKLGMDATRQSMEVLRNDDLRKSIVTLAELIPRERWQVNGYTREGLAQSDPLAALAAELANAGATNRFDHARNYMEKLSPHDLDALQKAALMAGRAVEQGVQLLPSFGFKKREPSWEETITTGPRGDQWHTTRERR